jgi:predicted esterase
MEKHFVHQKTFRYEVIGNKNANTVMYVLHGYGQLARFFIRKFEHLADEFLIVAPEGMHRFYLNGSSGRVGTSWMTKEDRETDIQDNLMWLNSLDKALSEEFTFSERIILGFSQGGATAARWYFNGNFQKDTLIIWASVFPPDIDRNEWIEQSQHNKNYFVLGTDDEYYDQEEQKAAILFYSTLNFNCLDYNGKHEIHKETLDHILRRNPNQK